MKQYDFDLDYNMTQLFFSAIRDKTDVIKILMNSIKIMTIGNLVKKDKITSKMLLNIDKMSRLFFVSNDKKYSISFPFSVKDEEGNLKFSSNFVEDINNKITSDILAIVMCNEKFESSCALEFVEKIIDLEGNNDSHIWTLLKELMMYEDGYIRYDYDQIGYDKALNDGYPKRHPLHHFDFFYTNSSTIKIGLKNKIDDTFFIDFMNIKTDCKFII